MYMPKKDEIKVLKKDFIEKKEKQEIVDSAMQAIKHILAMKNVIDKHKKELLSDMIWKISEVNGKWNVRYYSEGTLKDDNVSIYHEHVVSRKELIVRLFSNPEKYKEILNNVTACIVTKVEHDILEKQKNLSGWDRYKSARVKVYDRKQKKWIL